MLNADLISALRALPQPEPSMGKDAYDAIRRQRLELYPRCRENFDLYRAAQRGAVLNYLPIKLDIENVSRCNFRCTMCQVSEWEKGKRAEDMSYGDFKALLDEQYGLVEIKLQGMGEPTMAGAPLFDMIAYARQQSIWVRTVTNASLLHLKENYRHLIDCDPNEVQISIDGATEEVFTSIRRGADFKRVCSNCETINHYCDQQGVVRTKMWTVVQASNVHQMPELVDLAARLGFKSMVFSLNLTDWGSTEWSERNARVTVEDTLSADLAHALIARGAAQGVSVAFWSVTTKYDYRQANSLCPWPFERAYIASDMRVVPCCMIANPDTFELGDGHHFTDVWHGERMQNFRQDHLDGRIPAVCRNCYSA